MIKYVDTLVGFSEIPDEISLCINISNCPNNCPFCHSSYLKDDIGKELTYESLDNLIDSNNGITCVCLMGGDKNPEDIKYLAIHIRIVYPNLKIAWYSGKDEIAPVIRKNLDDFDYIKVGPYKEFLGPLNNPNTNQCLYKVDNGTLTDITYKFWK